MVTGHWTLYLRTPTCIANKDRHESNHPCYSRTFLLEFGFPAETQNKKVEAGVVVLRKLSLQVGRGLLPVILTGVVTALCASAAAQTNCNPPCGGQGPFRLFIGPAASSVPLGSPQYFWAIRAANQDFNGSGFIDVTSGGKWSSSNPSVATIDSASGVVATQSQGTTTISLRSGPFRVSTLLTVGPAVIRSIAVTPGNPTVSIPGGTQTFTAIATYTDSSTSDVTNLATWSSDSSTIATMANNVATTGSTAGSTYIHANYQSVDGRTGLNAGMTCINLSPANSTVPAGPPSIPFTATGHFGAGNCSDPPIFNVTGYVNWSSSNTTVADINASGVAFALTAGDATISATSPGLTGSTNLHVNPPTLQSLAIQPASAATIPQGTTQQYTAIGTYSDFSTQDLTATVTWNSSDTTVAAINSQSLDSGLARASTINTGTTQISASTPGCSGICNSNSATLNVTPPALQSITVTPANPSMEIRSSSPLGEITPMALRLI